MRRDVMSIAGDTVYERVSSSFVLCALGLVRCGMHLPESWGKRCAECIHADWLVRAVAANVALEQHR